MRTSITVLRGAYFFCVCVCSILCSGRRSSMQQSLEMRASEIESESVVCYWVYFVSSVFESDSSIRTI